MKRLVFAFLAMMSFVSAAYAADFKSADVLIYMRWKYVWNSKTGIVTPKGAYHHVSTEIGAEHVRKYFEQRGYSCLVTDNPEVWTSDALKKAKCIFFLNTQHEQFDTKEQREAFYSAVSNGTGVVVTHSSSWNERADRKRWRDFLGGFFSYHYKPQQPVPFTRVDRTHPAFSFFPEDYVWEKEEIYLNHPQENLRPLLILEWKDVLEESRNKDKEGCPKIGGHVLAWCKTYGKGRVFYTALGHNPKDWMKREFLYHLYMATKWAIGELPDYVDGSCK
jgi:type 1 glutamine amidotransferase